MKKRVFFLTRLQSGVDFSEYERFLSEVDYPLTLELLPVSYYRATRIEGRVLGSDLPPYQYVEVLDIDNYDAYQWALASPSPEIADLMDQVFSRVDLKTALDLYGEVVE